MPEAELVGRMPQAVYAAIVDHARAGKPEEICGIVRGRGLDATCSAGWSWTLMTMPQ